MRRRATAIEFTYDPEIDIAYLGFPVDPEHTSVTNTVGLESDTADPTEPGLDALHLDFAEDHKLVGIEVMAASSVLPAALLLLDPRSGDAIYDTPVVWEADFTFRYEDPEVRALFRTYGEHMLADHRLRVDAEHTPEAPGVGTIRGFIEARSEREAEHVAFQISSSALTAAERGTVRERGFTSFETTRADEPWGLVTISVTRFEEPKDRSEDSA